MDLVHSGDLSSVTIKKKKRHMISEKCFHVDRLMKFFFFSAQKTGFLCNFFFLH
ncbi:hypothetical protein C2G38_2072055 [Gigaspora rosea]|uniref:Uncharacterized protein n=1 Tax=Gigaspora rosea TaxID=44941 RepID=A0A397VMG3_9GLOM|nr:hypothetical protein C2G38_2072055 [Gigaspora rosea]